LGGPVWLPKIYNGKDRLFFMSNFEGFKERRLRRQLFTVPSVKMRNGDFSEVSTPIYDPLNRTRQFPGNVIPRDRFHPVSVKLMEEFYPAPNLNPGLVPFNYESTLNRFADKDQFIQRIDFVESSRSLSRVASAPPRVGEANGRILPRAEPQPRLGSVQLRVDPQPFRRQRPVHPTHRLRRVLKLQLVRPLQLGQRVGSQPYFLQERKQDLDDGASGNVLEYPHFIAVESE